LSFWDHLRRIAKALTPPPPLSARAEAQRKMDELWEEKRRYDKMIWAASDAVLKSVPAEMPRLCGQHMGAGLRLANCGGSYIFETDAGLAFAKEHKLTEWLDRMTREQLAAHGYPRHLISQFQISFTTDEDIQRVAGGNYNVYFH
jgi:hypothetical protein